MKYNLFPLLSLVDQSNEWPSRLATFFESDYDTDLKDQYYNILIQNLPKVKEILNSPVLVDQYTGLFSFDTEETAFSHSFNLAYWIERNAPMFHGKRLFILNHDYGLVNIQAKFCGLNVVNTLQQNPLNVGSVLACICNQGYPYPLNITKELPDYEVLIMSSVFQTPNTSWENWNYMVDSRAIGKEVYFTSNTFYHLKAYIDYDRLQIVEHPLHIYSMQEYTDVTYGYMNKIFKVK